MRKLSLLVVVLLVVGVSFTMAFTHADQGVTVVLDGQVMSFDADPVIVNGRTMVPLRALFEALTLEVTWFEESASIVATKEGTLIKLAIGSKTAQINGQDYTLDAEPFITGGRTMVPLRFVAESTGALVDWQAETYKVLITSQSSVAQDKLLPTYTYKIVDTGITSFYSDISAVENIQVSDAYYGQDAHYTGNEPTYFDHGDGTVSDLVTGLMWQQTIAEKMTYSQALAYANQSQLGGYSDWRLPTIKELFSLILYTGSSSGEKAGVLYLDTQYFDQPLGNTAIGEREIDAQTWSMTQYVSTTMKGDATVFGVNFIDGRIKGYPLINPQTKNDNTSYFRLVRGNPDYGRNIFVDNGDGTISDLATGLMWQKADDGGTRDWQEALAYCEALDLAGYDDWRLPNIKELNSLVDYTRSPDTSYSPAIYPLFTLTIMKDPEGRDNYGHYWSSTTHLDGKYPSANAIYQAFGEAQGIMNGQLLDVHGAGAVRSDPKSGNPSYYPTYYGPQGDIRNVFNYVIAVRNME